MAKLIYIESSPRKERSISIEVSKFFLDTYAGLHPDDEIETIDLWSVSLPEFDGFTINAKYKIFHGQNHSTEEATAWQTVTDIFNRFNSADKYLFSLPMWNFGIPYKLKHYIDIITQPGLAFNFDPATGYSGLVTDKPAAVIYARGGEYKSDGGAMDYQKPYFEMLLGFIGFIDIHPIVVEPTLSTPEDTEKIMESAFAQARKIANNF